MAGRRRTRSWAVGDRHRQLHRRGPRRQKQGASYGYTRQLGYHPIIAARADTGELLHIRNRKGKANTQRGAVRFVDELLARVHRVGHAGQVVIRADSGFENYKLMKALDTRGVEFSIGIKQSKTIRVLIEQIPEADWSRSLAIPRPARRRSLRPGSGPGG